MSGGNEPHPLDPHGPPSTHRAAELDDVALLPGIVRALAVALAENNDLIRDQVLVKVTHTDDRMDELFERIGAVERRVDKVEDRVDHTDRTLVAEIDKTQEAIIRAISPQFSSVKKRVDAIEGRLTKLEKRRHAAKPATKRRKPRRK